MLKKPLPGNSSLGLLPSCSFCSLAEISVGVYSAAANMIMVKRYASTMTSNTTGPTLHLPCCRYGSELDHRPG